MVVSPKPLPPIPNSEYPTDTLEVYHRLKKHYEELMIWYESEEARQFDKRRIYNYSNRLKYRIRNLERKITFVFVNEGTKDIEDSQWRIGI
jgi:hypothetical protein